MGIGYNVCTIYYLVMGRGGNPNPRNFFKSEAQNPKEFENITANNFGKFITRSQKLLKIMPFEAHF